MNFVLDQLFKRKKLIIILFTFLLGYGIYSYITIPKQDMPAINTPYMLLSIEAPSLSARDIEENAISDIEELISTFSDVIDVRSTIYDNFAIIITTFSFQTDDPTLLSSEIYEKINDLTLPEGITSIKYESNFDDPHIIFSLYSESLNETELLEYSSQFKNELLLVNEVKDVEIHSSYNREVSINLSLDLLDTYQLTILDIYQILYSKTTNLPLGYIESFGISIPVDGTITFETIEQLEEIVIIPKTELLPTDILLSDIANIEYIDTQEKEFYFNNKSANFISVYFDDDIDFTKMGDEIINV